MIKLSVSFDKTVKPFGHRELGALADAIDKELPTKKKELTVNVRVTSAEELRKLNLKYAGKNETTDVLSFNYAEGAELSAIDKAGDVVISYQQAQAQAKATGTTLATELALLSLHGLLHIIGRDHADASSRRRFDNLQKKIMTKAGLVYRKFGWES